MTDRAVVVFRSECCQRVGRNNTAGADENKNVRVESVENSASACDSTQMTPLRRMDGRQVYYRKQKIGAITEHLLDAEDGSTLIIASCCGSDVLLEAPRGAESVGNCHHQHRPTGRRIWRRRGPEHQAYFLS